MSRGAGSFSSVPRAAVATASSVDSDSMATTVRASPGLRPGAIPLAAIWRRGAGVAGSRMRFTGAGELLQVDLAAPRTAEPSRPARLHLSLAAHGRVRLRQERRARDDDRASRQPQAAHRLQAPRPEHPDVLAAHRRQRRVRGVLQGRAGRGRPAPGARHAAVAEHPVPQQPHHELHRRPGLHRRDLLREDGAGAERPVRRPHRRHARPAHRRAGDPAHLRRDERRRDRPGAVHRRLLGPGGHGRQRLRPQLDQGPVHERREDHAGRALRERGQEPAAGRVAHAASSRPRSSPTRPTWHDIGVRRSCRSARST